MVGLAEYAMAPVLRSRLACLSLLAAVCVAADCASPLVALALFGTSHRISIAPTGSLVLHHDASADDPQVRHSHALADVLMIAMAGDDTARDGDHTIAPSASERLTSQRASASRFGQFDACEAIAKAPSSAGSGRAGCYATSVYAGLAPPLLRSIVLRI